MKNQPANMNNHHFLLVSCPGQGLINPTLQFAKRLARAGAQVTFATTVHGLRRINNLPSFHNISFASFSDGYDDGPKPTDDLHHIMAEFKRVGSQTLTNLILTLANERRPVTFLIYTFLLPWAADVARNLHIPSAFLCIQSVTAFAIYHRYFNGHNGLYDCDKKSTSISIDLPGIPLLTSKDVPSFLLPTSPHASVIPTFQEHIQTLEQDPNPCILANTFDALEGDVIRAVGNMSVIAIGPLIPSAFSDEKDPSDKSFGFDLFESSTSEDYLQWLNSKPESSVVYVSFGSMVVWQKREMEEVLYGLVESRRPFLWVVRPPEDGREEFENMLKNHLKEEVEGLIVPWCSQVEVLCHKSVGCFVMHCGWNSTMESMVAGVPVVGCPHFSDQTTNAKLVEEVWGNGVKARANEEGVVEREEMKRCVEMTMGSGKRGEEMRRNAEKWKSLAVAAVKEGGSSDNNLRSFLERFG
ncbi:hypothetical protein L1049_017505 [Liquidambar formosana]|uniref:Glycosyltransferase n=1 Tax=Liquidambar formosana TaxID=63359 RepID=A0AAP0S3D5_LIQFO